MATAEMQRVKSPSRATGNLYARAEDMCAAQLLLSEASKRTKGKIPEIEEAAAAMTVMVGYMWGKYTATQEELMRIGVKKRLNLRLTKEERATWTLYGPKD